MDSRSLTACSMQESWRRRGRRRGNFLVTVLLNAQAFHAEKRKGDIAALFRAAGSEALIVELQRDQDPAEAARAASTRTPVVVAAGGDGTVRSVAAGLVTTPAALGVLPLGTLNHFAKDLHIPLDLKQAVATIVAGRVGRVDVGEVNDRVFVNNSSIGLYPSIVEAREELRRRGHRKWPAFALATFQVLRHHRGVSVRIEVNGRQAVRRTPFVLVGNNEYQLDGIRLGSRATLDGGRLFTYLAPRVHTREMPMLVARALLGRARPSEDFEIISAPELWIDTPNARDVHVALDGEIATMTSPLHFRICPGALKVLLPPA
jgi:diacylglycerol kinase family enzyme